MGAVGLIRRSKLSAVGLARELGVSDTLIRKVRRGENWNGAAGARNRNDVPRRVVVDTLILAGLRVSELCLQLHSTRRRGECRLAL